MSTSHWFEAPAVAASIRFIGHHRCALPACRISHLWSAVTVYRRWGLPNIPDTSRSTCRLRRSPPRHQKEREEYERRERVLTEKSR